ncbi:hypothetical protein C0989_005508, partial [Termitomyces sp. Mn162]
AESPPPAATGLPSPTPSSHESLRRSVSPLPSSSDFIPLPTISRKRRLSASDGQGASKRPRGAPAASRSHVQSDPRPMPSSTSFGLEVSDLDNWFNAQLGIMNPVNFDSLDESQGLDFDFYTYPEVDTPSISASSLVEQSPTPQCVDIPTSIIGDQTPSCGLEASSASFDYHKLFDNHTQPLFSHQDLAYHQVQDALPQPQPLLSEFSFLTNLPGVPQPCPYADVSSAGATHSSITGPISNNDWNLFPFEELLNRADILQDFDTASSSGIITSPHPQSLNEEKADIQLQLAAMKEEMRRLEARLARSFR